MKGITFTELMHAYFMAGIKTNTRRVVDKEINREPDNWRLIDQVVSLENAKEEGWHIPDSWKSKVGAIFQYKDAYFKIVVPHYQPGEVLYIKEPFFKTSDDRYLYKFDFPLGCSGDSKFTSPRFMPERAARFHLLIKSVRAERLMMINNADAKSEGFKGWADYYSKKRKDGVYIFQNMSPQEPNYAEDVNIASFLSFWKLLHGKESCESNPWVWRYEIEKVAIER